MDIAEHQAFEEHSEDLMTVEESLKRILYLSYHLSDVQKHAEALTGIGENNSEDQNHVVFSPMFMTSAPLWLNQKDRINTKVIFSHLSKLFSPSVFFSPSTKPFCHLTCFTD